MKLLPFIKRGAWRATRRPVNPCAGPAHANAQRAGTSSPPRDRALRLAHTEQPSDRERLEHRRTADERAARARLYPHDATASRVVAFPTRPPVHPEAAA